MCGGHRIGKLKEERMSRERLRKTHKCLVRRITHASQKGRPSRKLVAVGHTATVRAQWYTHGTSFIPFGSHVATTNALARHQVVCVLRGFS